MRRSVISLIVILPILILPINGTGYTESKIAKIYNYEFPVAEDSMYKSHMVTFAHAKHAMQFKITCVQCHHTLEPGAIAVEETCRDCHGREAIRNQQNRRAPGEKKIRPYLIALHDMCIDCHKEIKKFTSNVKAPLACWQCHIRKKK